MTTSQAVLDVTGMHCHSCSALIDETLADLPGVVSSQTSRPENLSTVQFDAEQVTVGDLVAAIKELGYTATPR
jgi:Cu+-exporting ATPase